jgi:hypothetical protein
MCYTSFFSCTQNHILKHQKPRLQPLYLKFYIPRSSSHIIRHAPKFNLPSFLSVVDDNGDPNRFAQVRQQHITMATPKSPSSRLLMLAACWAALSTTTTTTTLAWAPQRGPFRSLTASHVVTHLSSTTAPASASAEGTTATTTAMRGKTLEHEHCQSPGDRDILVRAARGEQTERTPVWLMRYVVVSVGTWASLVVIPRLLRTHTVFCLLLRHARFCSLSYIPSPRAQTSGSVHGGLSRVQQPPGLPG